MTSLLKIVSVSSESSATEQVYREDLGFDETVVKVSLQEAQERVKLVFGIELPDYQYTFAECVKWICYSFKDHGAFGIVLYLKSKVEIT